jgi:hypothetical protein
MCWRGSLLRLTYYLSRLGGGVRSSPVLLAFTAFLAALGCSDGGTGPGSGGDGSRLAAQFERLADSVAGDSGYSPTAEALRHAAEIVRLTGHATPVTLTIDGSTRSFLAVAEQLDFPNLHCTWPADTAVVPPRDTVLPPPPDTVVVPPSDSMIVSPPDSTGEVPPDGGGGEPGDTVVPPPMPGEPPECIPVGTYSMRTLIAWEPENMAEVVRIVADLGSNQAATGVPDVMTGLPSKTVAVDSSPTPSPPDSSGGGVGGYPGFMGEYLVRDVGSWWAVEGSQANALEDVTGACTDDRATFYWAEFDCEATRFRFEFSMRVEPLRYEPPTGVADPPGGPEGSHTLALGSSSIDGVRLTVVAWVPPPEPWPGDSTVAERMSP